VFLNIFLSHICTLRAWLKVITVTIPVLSLRFPRNSTGDGELPIIHIACNTKVDDATDAILFLSTNRSRQERTHGLYNLASMAYVRLGLRRITAIATEPKDGPGRSLDVIILNDVKFEDPDEVIKAAEKAFAPPRYIEGYEYSG
jgi:hypothetical protein